MYSAFEWMDGCECSIEIIMVPLKECVTGTNSFLEINMLLLTAERITVLKQWMTESSPVKINTVLLAMIKQYYPAPHGHRWRTKDFCYLFFHLPIKFHNFWWDLGSFAPSPSSSWFHRYPPPTFATTRLSLSMSLFYCSLVALYLLLPLDSFTPGLHHLRWPWLTFANGIFHISHVIDAGPFTLAPYPLPINPCYFYVVRCPLNFKHFWFYIICWLAGPGVT